MAKRQRASSSSLFLMELILAILFFCIAGTICISVFTRAHIMHKDSIAINNSVRIARDTAEVIRSSRTKTDIIELLDKVYSDNMIGDNFDENITVYFDADFYDTDDTDAPYYMLITLDESGKAPSYNISVYKALDSSLLYDLDVTGRVRGI